MYWQQSVRLTTLRRAMLAALTTSIGMIGTGLPAQAATLGAISIQSGQHEPLMATIEIEDIDSDSFFVGVAGNDIYHKMGLNPTPSLSVRFVPANATSGRLVVQTDQPIFTPFTDVVLRILDQNRQQIIPKTLLMPLDNSALKITPKSLSASAASTNLPTADMAIKATAQPLIVKKSAPPPLLPSPHNSSTSQLLAKADPITPDHLSRRTQSAKLHSKKASQVNLYQNNAAPILTKQHASVMQGNQAANSVRSHQSQDHLAPLSIAPRAQHPTPQNNGQSGILNVKVVRKVRRSQLTPDAQIVAKDLTTQDSTTTHSTNRPYLSKKTPILAKTIKPTDPKPAFDDTLTLATTPHSIPSGTSNTALNTKGIDPSQSQHATIYYTVQHNDNLWSIANALAKKNNLKVRAVMDQIFTQNPNAFINQDINLLKAKAKLSLPNYDIIPSQPGFQSAINPRRSPIKDRQITDNFAASISTDNAPKPSSKSPIEPTLSSASLLPQASISSWQPITLGKLMTPVPKSSL